MVALTTLSTFYDVQHGQTNVCTRTVMHCIQVRGTWTEKPIPQPQFDSTMTKYYQKTDDAKATWSAYVHNIEKLYKSANLRVGEKEVQQF